jgi:hypothetical protein
VTLYVKTAVFLAVLLAGFFGGWQTRAWKAGADDGRRIKAEGVEASRMRAQAKIEIRYRTITKEVLHVLERPVYRNVCMDADGLRLLNEQISGVGDASQPAATVPGAGVN